MLLIHISTLAFEVQDEKLYLLTKKKKTTEEDYCIMFPKTSFHIGLRSILHCLEKPNNKFYPTHTIADIMIPYQ